MKEDLGFHAQCHGDDRYPSLKAAAQSGDEWTHYDKPNCDIKEIEFKPEKWSRGWRTLIVRQLRKKPLKGPLQLHLFEPVSREFEYSVIVSNRRHHADHVVQFHHGRGYQEKLIGEAKQYAGLAVIVSQHRAANEMHTVCSMMAHNLGREYQMRTNRHRRQSGANQRSFWRFESLGSLAQKIFRQAGRLIRPQGQLTLEVSSNEKRNQRLLRDLQRLQAPI